MRGSRAKEIRKRSANLLLSLGIQLDEGRGEYNQAENCKIKKPLILDNKVIRNEYGQPVMIDGLTGGTVHSRHKYKLFYKWLKKIYKNKDVDTDTILGETATMMRKQMHEDAQAALDKAEAKNE